MNGKTYEILPQKKAVLNILHTQNFVAEKLSEVFKPHDLSTEQFNVLRILRGRKGCPANMFSIQENIISRTSHTTRLVDKLLLKELVTRQICPQNRRKIEVQITTKGIELLNEVDPMVDAIEKEMAANLSDAELDTLNLLLQKYRKADNDNNQ